MIHVEKTNGNRISMQMNGRLEDLLVEVTIAIKDVLKAFPEEQWGSVVAEISANALMFAHEDLEDGETVGNATVISNSELLEEAIKKTTGGDN